MAAMDYEHGVVSPGGVGFDINCGVRLVRSTLTADDVREDLEDGGALAFIRTEEAGGKIDLGAELELALVILCAGADEPDGAPF